MADSDVRGRPDRCVFKDLCIDASDPHLMAPFWAAALGLGAEAHDNGGYVLRDAVAEHTVWINRVPEPRTVKQRVHLDLFVAEVADLERLGARQISELPKWTVQAVVPEPKTVKNRIHWDVLGDTSGLVAAGARLLRSRDDGLAWDVRADPEGNEFCVFPRSL